MKSSSSRAKPLSKTNTTTFPLWHPWPRRLLPLPQPPRHLPLRLPPAVQSQPVPVSVGQAVKAGQVLVIIEAMKMENEVAAPCDGVVKQIVASKGAVVATGDALLVI